MPDSPQSENLFLRLYFDRHIKKQLVMDLRERGFDVLTTEEANMDTASDENQLAFAAKQDRVVSHQLGGRDYGLLLSRTLRLLNQMTAEEMQNNLVYLEQFK